MCVSEWLKEFFVELEKQWGDLSGCYPCITYVKTDVKTATTINNKVLNGQIVFEICDLGKWKYFILSDEDFNRPVFDVVRDIIYLSFRPDKEQNEYNN